MKILNNYLYLIKNFLKYGKKYVIFLSLITLLSPVATIMDTLIVKVAIDSIESNSPLMSILPFIVVYVLSACLLYIASALFVKSSSLELIEIGNRMNKDIFKIAKRKDYINTETSQFYDVYSWTVQGYFTRSLAAVKIVSSFLSVLLNIIAIVSLIATVDWLTIMFSIFNVLSVMCLNIFTRKLEYNKKMELIKCDRLDSYIRRIFYIPDYAADIRVTGLCRHLLNKFDSNKTEKLKINKRYMNKSLVSLFFIKFIPMIIFVLTIIYLIIRQIRGTTSYGEFALLLAASQNLTSELMMITDLLPNIVEQGMHAQKMIEFESLKSDIETCDMGEKLAGGPCSIEFRNVSFKYKNMVGNVISDFSLHIRPNERIAIVGKNGAGKSTIVKLLLRLYDPLGGEILINDVNLKKYSVKSVRESVGLVMQTNNLYALSLKENIFLNDENPTLTDDRLGELFAMIGLSLPKQGFDAPLTREFDDDGLVFSGGEKQKLALLKTMAKYYPIIILDEPTSSLDPVSEGQYIDLIENCLENSTIIMIAHRLSTIKNFDAIVVVDEGKIVEYGTHGELMRKRGIYYKMYSNQANRYEKNDR